MKNDCKNCIDRLFQSYSEKIGRFVFDEKVASVFDDMISRSVPGYPSIIAMTKLIAEEFARPNTNIYDLGCSTGTGTLAIIKGITESSCTVIAADKSAAMIEKAKSVIEPEKSKLKIKLIVDDIRNIPITNASLAVLNLTLQFIEPGRRDAVIRKIYSGLIPAGALMLTEKIRFDNPDRQKLFEKMHESFKRLNGYSDMEIAAKRKALENVLIPETLEDHIRRLVSSGFEKANIYCWFKCLNFVSILAVKQ